MRILHDYDCNQTETDICTCGADDARHAQAEIARLTRERDEARAKVAAAYEMAATVSFNGIELVRPAAQSAIRALADPDATAAMNRVRAGAMREAAEIGGEYMSTDADVLLVEMWREDILARADAVERGE